MTHSNFPTVLRRVSERLASGVGAIALTACLFVATDARAASDSVDVAPGVTVRYESDALSSIEGTARVYRKLKSAARKVCGIDSGHDRLAERVVKDKCYDAALAAVVRKVDRPQLSALHQSATARRMS